MNVIDAEDPTNRGLRAVTFIAVEPMRKSTLLSKQTNPDVQNVESQTERAQKKEVDHLPEHKSLLSCIIDEISFGHLG